VHTPGDARKLLPHDQMRRQLNELHEVLLAAHKALLDHERIRFEQVHHRIESPGEFLQLAMGDPFFAWLRVLSGLITQIDEFVCSKEPPDLRSGAALLAQARTILTPTENGNEFQSNYLRAMQESPEVALAHAQWKLSNFRMDR